MLSAINLTIISFGITYYNMNVISSSVIQLAIIDSFALLFPSNINLKFKTILIPDMMNPSAVASISSELYYTEKVDLFIGPIFSVELNHVGRMASDWNIPIFSLWAWSSEFLDKKKFSTLTRLTCDVHDVAEMIVKIINKFYWKDIAVFYGPTAVSITGRDIYQTLLKMELYNVVEFSFQQKTKSLESKSDYKRMLIEASRLSRVFIFTIEPVSLRDIMLVAYELNMTSGDYVFIVFIEYKWEIIHWEVHNDTDKNAFQAFQSILLLTYPDTPDDEEYKNFTRRVREIAKEQYNFPENNTIEDSRKVYTSVYLYSVALNESFSQEKYLPTGQTLMRRLWNRTFKIPSDTIYIGENGDLKCDFVVRDFNLTAKEFSIVMKYHGKSQSLQSIAPIHWPGRNTPPPNLPYCGFSHDSCKDSNNTFLYVVLGLVGFGLVGTVFIYIIYRKFRLYNMKNNPWWIIDIGKLTIIQPGLQDIDEDILLMENFQNDGFFKKINTRKKIFKGKYKDEFVAVKILDYKMSLLNESLLQDLLMMKKINHVNLNIYIGIVFEKEYTVILSDYGIKGSFQAFLGAEKVTIDWTLRFSFIRDLTEALFYLHFSPLRFHGHLSSQNCVLTGRLILKVTDYGLNTIYRKNTLTDADKLWIAPELLRLQKWTGTQKGDIYSYAIIIQEIITLTGPHHQNYEELCPCAVTSIIASIKNNTTPYYRPSVIKSDCPDEIFDLMHDCWAEDVNQRPNITEIRKRLMLIKSGKEYLYKNLVDVLLSRLEKYSLELEMSIEERTEALIEEKSKVDFILSQLLPRSVLNQLSEEGKVEPELYQSVSLFFSDIVQFTALCSDSTPFQVIRLLNDLYTMFDEVLICFDVYKVETIGDAYMVVSGLPIRNGNAHSREVAKMSLCLLNAISIFKIHHKPHHKLQVRIGLHSGSVVAGVVGLKMPRYCLFGSTVTITQNLEQTSKAMGIHISGDFNMLLQDCESFKTKARKDILIKNFGMMQTYWLLEESR